MGRRNPTREEWEARATEVAARASQRMAAERAPAKPAKTRAGRWDRVNDGRKRARAEGRSTRTKPETALLAYLEAERVAGRIAGWIEQPCSLVIEVLGELHRYRPDALSWAPLTLWEAKGARDFGLDAQGRYKLDAAVRTWPFARVRLFAVARDGTHAITAYDAFARGAP